MVFSPKDDTILSGSSEGSLILWRVATGKSIRTFPGHEQGVNSVAFSPDGLVAVSGSNDGTMKLWEVATGKELKTLVRDVGAPVTSVAYLPDGLRVLSGSQVRGLKLWDIASGKDIIYFEGSPSYIRSVALSPDGRFALSIADYGSVGDAMLWDIAGRKIKNLGSSWFGSAFSPDGRLILAGLRLFDAVTRSEIIYLGSVTDYDRQRREISRITPLYAVTFSPSGRFVLAGGRGAPSLELYDVSEWSEPKAAAN